MKRRALVVALFATVVLNGCGAEDPTGGLSQADLEKEQIVLENAALVRAAADAFAAETGGRYPADVDSDTTPSGKTLIDLLPDGALLLNPFERQRLEPRNGLAQSRGAIGYEQVEAVPGSMQMNAWGAYEQILYVDNLDDIVATARANAEVVHAAVEAYAADNAGLYPDDVETTANIAGKKLVDYLPEGRRLYNAYQGTWSEPVERRAERAGEVGYVPRRYWSVPLGYRLEAIGLDGGHVFDHDVREADLRNAHVRAKLLPSVDGGGRVRQCERRHFP